MIPFNIRIAGGYHCSSPTLRTKHLKNARVLQGERVANPTLFKPSAIAPTRAAQLALKIRSDFCSLADGRLYHRFA